VGQTSGGALVRKFERALVLAIESAGLPKRDHHKSCHSLCPMSNSKGVSLAALTILAESDQALLAQDEG
jgi:hypothetical protein